MRYAGWALLALPFVGVALWGRFHLAPRWGDALARRLGQAASLLPEPPPPTPPTLDSSEVAALLDGLDGPDAGVPVPGTDAGARSVARGTHDGGSAAAGLRPGVVHVPASAVERAIEDGGKSIHGRTVRGADGKPAGVKLTGVSSAHVGLQDGDVVVAVDGRPTPTDDDATEAALQAIGRGATSLRATVMRGAQPIEVVLDLPVGPAAGGKKTN